MIFTFQPWIRPEESYPKAINPDLQTQDDEERYHQTCTHSTPKEDFQRSSQNKNIPKDLEIPEDPRQLRELQSSRGEGGGCRNLGEEQFCSHRFHLQ